MSFLADKQTLEDLNILGSHKANSIIRIFDRVVTGGGRKLIHDWFKQPLTDADEINKRSNIIRFFSENLMVFPFSNEEFGVLENYLYGGGENQLMTGMTVITKKVKQLAVHDDDYDALKTGILQTISLLRRFYKFVLTLPQLQSPYTVQLDIIKSIFNHKKMQWLQLETELTRLSVLEVAKYDYLLRTHMQEEMKKLTELIFHLDVYIAVSRVASERGFCFAHALTADKNCLEITEVYHPAIQGGIGNSLAFDERTNTIFLTGANMAGKSTLMKSIGISVYLAHMGFPIAAKFMQFSVKDGLYTSINVHDNLDQGYSHFYAEVLRVKTVAQQVASDKNLVVIFDELFKGTNVKDAYDATLAITQALSENSNCFFVISTHITEVGEKLKEATDNFRFVYLPTIMEGVVPRYTYQLKDGITADKHGMIIIENEGVLELLKN